MTMQADPRIPTSPPDDLLSGRRGFFTPGGFAWMWQYTAPPMRMGPILCVHDLDLTSVPPGMPERKYYRVPGFPYTQRSLEEQLRLIQEHQLEMAYIVARDISFLPRCPSLRYLTVQLTPDAPADFDFSPLYEMPELRYLSCTTTYGLREECHSPLDYRRVRGLRELAVHVGRGSIGFDRLPELEWLSLSKDGKFRSRARSFASWELGPNLKTLMVTQFGIHSLEGLERAPRCAHVELAYCRNLEDISALAACGNSLRHLEIEQCGRIRDFSCLESLTELRCLRLMGSNTIPDLSFLKNMKKLERFYFNYKVLDGDLSPCMEIPYAQCCHRYRHYNYRDEELPKWGVWPGGNRGAVPRNGC